MRGLARLRGLRGPSLVEDFDAVALGRPTRDRHELFTELRKKEPILYSRALAAWVVTRYDDVRSVFDDARFGHVTHGPGMTVLQGGFQAWRGHEHSKKMGIVGRRLRSPRALKELSPRVEAIARELAERLPIGREVELRQEYAVQIPLLVFCELAALDEPAGLSRWSANMVSKAASVRRYEDVAVAGAAALQELRELIGPALAERHARAGPDLISDLANATYDGRPLPDDEIALVVAQLFVGTLEAERLLTCAFRYLAQDRHVTGALRERRGDDDALSSFGAEALRFFSPIQAVSRRVLAGAHVAGRDLSEGETVVGVLASANRDERRFSDPHRFDPDRFLQNPDRQFTPAGDILPFGAGEHYCTGARVGQLMIVHGCRQLLERVGRVELTEAAPDIGGLMSSSPAFLRVVLQAPS